MKCRIVVAVSWTVMALLTGQTDAANPGETNKKDSPCRVNYSYAIAPPHRLALARPDSGDKTLLDLAPEYLRLGWTYNSMATLPAHTTYGSLRTTWHVTITAKIDGRSLSHQTYVRTDGYLPVLQSTFQDKEGTVQFEAAGCRTAMVCQVQAKNTDTQPHVFAVNCTTTHDELLNQNASTRDKRCDFTAVSPREDHVVLLRIGGDSSPLTWTLKPGQSKTAWIVRPYRGRITDLSALREHDWEKELVDAKKEWTDLVGRSVRMEIPDAAVQQALWACLADIFVMREPVPGDCIVGTAGTEVYRGPNTWEPGLAAVALDQMGFHREAELGFRSRLEHQDRDGHWEPGAHHTFFCATGMKAWVAMEHYRLTGDRDYLERVYPRMLASARSHECQRATTRRLEDGKRTSSYGMLVGGLVDCGMSDPTGRRLFYAHNIWAVFGDRLALEAAKTLGHVKDAAELEDIVHRGQEDLLKCMEIGAIQNDGYRWLSGAPDKAAGCQWGVLNALFPCRLLPPDHELITGSIRRMESNMSPGGLPMHSGWMPQGMWVAVTLDNLAEQLLVRGDGDAFAKYLYAVLNHATPLVTWCEERGKEAGTTAISGDRHHLYTPENVVSALRYAMVMEDGEGLHLARGTARQWLGSGKPMGIAKAPTHFGQVSFEMRYDAAKSRVTGKVTFAEGREPAWAMLHVRLPGKLRVTVVTPDSGATVLPGGEGLRWNKPHGDVRFEATVGN